MALRFDGQHSYVAVAPKWPGVDAREVSLAAWVRFDRLPSEAERSMTIFGKSASDMADLELQAEPDNRI
jgi:hypothetical protein